MGNELVDIVPVLGVDVQEMFLVSLFPPTMPDTDYRDVASQGKNIGKALGEIDGNVSNIWPNQNLCLSSSSSN